MPESCSLKSDRSKANADPDGTAISCSDNGCSTQSVNFNQSRGDLSDTGEDLTTDTISKGRLKHELRMARTHLATKALTLENNEKLSSARELELQDEIRTLSRRLALADTRCEAALLVASQAAQIEDQLMNAVQVKKQLCKDNAQLTNDVHAVRQFFAQLPLDRLVYTVEGPERAFEINVSSYSLLNSADFERLREQSPTDLAVIDLVKLSIHRLVTLFAEELVRLRRQLEGAAETFLFDSAKSHFFATELGPRQEISDNQQLCSRKVRFTHEPGQKTRSLDSEPEDSGSQQQQQRVTSSAVTATPEPVGIALELQAANKQIDLLRQDKEYLSKQISSLTNRLTNAEQDLVREKQHAASLAEEVQQSKNQANRNEQLAVQQVEINLRNQLTELSGLTGQQLARIQAFHDEMQLKEMDRLRDQRDKALTECDSLKLQLKSMSEQLQAVQSAASGRLTAPGAPHPMCARTACAEEDFTVRKQLAKAAVELEAAKSAKTDALLQVEKLLTQLDESKQAFYELRSKYHQDRVQFEAKISATEQKLAAYEEMETAIDEVVELHAGSAEDPSLPQDNRQLVLELEHLCIEGHPTASARSVGSGSLFLPTLAARRLEHSLRLAKQVAQLKVECQKLVTERDAKLHEIKVAKAAVDRSANLIALMSQPADCLVLSLTEKDQQLHACQTELATLRQHRAELERRCDRLQSERDQLARDLQRVLSRRKNLVHLRKQLTQLVQEQEKQTSGGRRRCTACHLRRGGASLDRARNRTARAASPRMLGHKQACLRSDSVHLEHLSPRSCEHHAMIH